MTTEKETSAIAKNRGIEKLPPNPLNEIKRVIAVMSGKGGVGKSAVTSLLAVSLSRAGRKVGILDADVTGPSIPKIFGVGGKPESSGELGLIPPTSAGGVEIMSLNLLLTHEDDPVIWRGPLIAGAIRQFWTDVIWGELDYLLVDLPPGTGDAPLTVLQSLPLAGLLIVASPQELAVMVVRKAIKMATLMNIPIHGLVENMSFAVCPHCGEVLRLFGPSRGEEVARELGLKFLGALPIDPRLAELCDVGKIEAYTHDVLEIMPQWVERG